MRHIRSSFLLATALLALTAAPVFAQATGTLTGTVLDQDSLILPGASVVATNTDTGAARETVTTGTGTYTIPALLPGPYEISAELPGFDSALGRATVVTAATVTVDLQMGIAALEETVTVSAAAPLVETTQAVVASSIRQAEVRELPMVNRSLASMMTLLPGAREVPATGSHGHASNYVSFAGNTGRSYNMYVDGIDNKEDQDGGTLLQYSLDGIEEFRALGAGFQAEYGRGSTVVTLATKSGTNQFTGTTFLFGRNESTGATDHFSRVENGGFGEQPFHRLQYGASVGGPIAEDRAWFFSSVERIDQGFQLPRAARVTAELNRLIGVVPGIEVGAAIPQPFKDLLFQARADVRMSNSHTGFFKLASQHGYVDNPAMRNNSVLWGGEYAQRNDQNMYAAVGGWTWVPNNTSVNELRMQFMYYLHEDINGASCAGTWNECVLTRMNFPSVRTDRPFFASDTWVNFETKFEIVNNFSKQIGRHYVKFGVDIAALPTFYADLQYQTPGVVYWFDDPSVILDNTDGRYPQGFLTPGAVARVAVSSQFQVEAHAHDSWFFAGYIQDDFQVTPKLTINMGLRYDFNEMTNNCCWDQNRTGRILRAIDHPYGEVPSSDTNNWGPRLGFAYDVQGDGTDVVRGSFGLFYATGIITSSYVQNLQEQEYVLAQSSIANRGVGDGQLADFVYGVTPLPVVEANPTEFFPGNRTAGFYYHPGFADAYSINSSVGLSHLFGPSTVLSVDYLNVLVRNGWRRLEINPLLAGGRALAPATERVFNDPHRLGPTSVLCACNEGRYDGIDVHFEHRLQTGSAFQVNYTLAWARGMGGSTDFTTQGFFAGPERIDPLGQGIYDEHEWGPTAFDERHRVTFTGVIPVPGGFTVAPLVIMATARPYTTWSGVGQAASGFGLSLLYSRDANGNPLGPYNARGKALVSTNARVTKTFGLAGGQDMSVFVEFYNILNRANFGRSFNGNEWSPLFGEPTGYLGGIASTTTLPISFQVQFGARYEF